MSVSCNYILLFTNNLLNYNFFDLVEEIYTTLYLHHTLQTNDHVTIEDVLNITWYSYNLRGKKSFDKCTFFTNYNDIRDR